LVGERKTRQHPPEIANSKTPVTTEKENIMNSKNTINEILDALAAQQQRGESSLVVSIEPGLIPDATNALRSYKKLFAPVIPGTDGAPIYAEYDRMRQGETGQTILLLVECQTTQEFRDAIGQMPIRKSSEWRSVSMIASDSFE
jgi:hypothetical protein